MQVQIETIVNNFINGVVANPEPIHTYAYSLHPSEAKCIVQELQERFDLVLCTVDLDNLPQEPLEVYVQHQNYLMLQIGLKEVLFAHPLSPIRARQLLK